MIEFWNKDLHNIVYRLRKYFNKTLKVLKGRPIKPMISKILSPDF
jgi:hypothetical protein